MSSLGASRVAIVAVLSPLASTCLAVGPLRAADLTLRNLVIALRDADPSKPLDLSHRDLSSLDLSDLDFKRSNLASANLLGANLTEANLAFFGPPARRRGEVSAACERHSRRSLRSWEINREEYMKRNTTSREAEDVLLLQYDADRIVR